MMTQLLRQGRSIQGFAYDTALAAYVLEPARSGYALKDLMERYCGTAISDGLAGEAAAIAQLYTVLPEQVKQAGMEQVYWDIDFPLCPVLAEMEHAVFSWIATPSPPLSRCSASGSPTAKI